LAAGSCIIFGFSTKLSELIAVFNVSGKQNNSANPESIDQIFEILVKTNTIKSGNDPLAGHLADCKSPGIRRIQFLIRPQKSQFSDDAINLCERIVLLFMPYG
jgi:hypothetical protein